MGWITGGTTAVAAAEACLEIAIPLAELRPSAGRTLGFRVLVLQGGVEIERHPEESPIEIVLDEVTRD